MDNYSNRVLRSSDGPSTQIVSLTPRSALRISLAIFVAFFLIELARNIPDTLTRVALGVTFAFALDPVVSRIERRLHCSRPKAVFIVAAIALCTFALLVAVVGPRAVSEARGFSRELPETVDKLTTLPVVGDVLQRLDAPERIREWANDLPSRLDNDAIGNLLESLIGGLVSGLTVIVVAIATLSDGQVLVRRIKRLIPEAHRERAAIAGNIFRRTIGAYFAGSLLVSGIAATFVLTTGLALGVPLAPVAALWVLVVSLIPQIGGFLSASVFTILGFAESPGTGLACLVLYIVYMNIENHILAPIIVGKAVDLSAAATMLAALIGASAAGVPGAIIATPLVGTVKALYAELSSSGSQLEQPEPLPHHKLRDFIRRKFRRTDEAGPNGDLEKARE